MTAISLMFLSACSNTETVIKTNIPTTIDIRELSQIETDNSENTVPDRSIPINSFDDDPELAKNTNSFFFATFIDVEQGDCAIINCNNHFAIIDGGSPNESSKIYTYLKDNDISHFDYVIASHPDSDHIGGLSGALNYASADTVLCSKESDAKEYYDLVKYVEQNETEISFPSIGDVFELDEATMEVLAVNIDTDNDNNSSIVLKVSYGDTTLLFTGDAEEPVEEYLIENNIDIDCDLLKVSHHGSKYSSSQSFLEKSSPYISVICVGRSNTYGHPANEVLNRLNFVGSKVYMTDSKNDIVCSSNKQEISCILTSH